MRFIVLHSLQEYPLRQVETAVAATASQLGLVATGHGTHDHLAHLWDHQALHSGGAGYAAGPATAWGVALRPHQSAARADRAGFDALAACALRARWFAGASMTLLALPPPPQSPCSPMPSSAARCPGRTIAMVRASPGLRLSPSLSPSCRRSRRLWVSAEKGLVAPAFRSVPLGCQIAAQPPPAAIVIARFRVAHETIRAKALAAMASVLRFPAPGSSSEKYGPGRGREQAQAHEGQFVCDGFYDVGCNEHFETEQQRATDSDFVDVRSCSEIGCRSWRRVDQAMPVTITRTPKISMPLPTMRMAESMAGSRS